MQQYEELLKLMREMPRLPWEPYRALRARIQLSHWVDHQIYVADLTDKAHFSNGLIVVMSPLTHAEIKHHAGSLCSDNEIAAIILYMMDEQSKKEGKHLYIDTDVS